MGTRLGDLDEAVSYTAQILEGGQLPISSDRTFTEITRYGNTYFLRTTTADFLGYPPLAYRCCLAILKF